MSKLNKAASHVPHVAKSLITSASIGFGDGGNPTCREIRWSDGEKLDRAVTYCTFIILDHVMPGFSSLFISSSICHLCLKSNVCQAVGLPSVVSHIRSVESTAVILGGIEFDTDIVILSIGE